MIIDKNGFVGASQNKKEYSGHIECSPGKSVNEVLAEAFNHLSGTPDYKKFLNDKGQMEVAIAPIEYVIQIRKELNYYRTLAASMGA